MIFLICVVFISYKSTDLRIIIILTEVVVTPILKLSIKVNFHL